MNKADLKRIIAFADAMGMKDKPFVEVLNAYREAEENNKDQISNLD